MSRVLIYLLLFSAIARADDSLSVSSRIGRDAMSVLGDGALFFTAPLRGSADDWLTAGVLAGGVFLSSAADNSLRTASLRSHSETGDRFASFGTEYGNAKYGIGLSGLLYVTGLCAGRREYSETGMMLFESIAFAGITTTVLKEVIGRSRPYAGEGSGSFHPFKTENQYFSFPSGHSTVAFAVSSVLASRCDNITVTIGFYALAVITAWSRTYNDEHWLSDDVAGAIIGITAGVAAARNRHPDREETALHVYPTGNGLRAVLTF